ncbi:MAG: hypothetical protein OEV42_03490 [Deltaproteobacteria bacterium]|nr:hypothetical protein [Deltaproteobacteria bacterium]
MKNQAPHHKHRGMSAQNKLLLYKNRQQEIHAPGIQKLKGLICLLIASLLMLPSCTTLPRHPLDEEQKTFIAEEGEGIFNRHAPVFIVERPEKKYNLIGTPAARTDKKGEEKIFVDPGRAAVFYEKRIFETEKGKYTNLFYRVHFKKVPSFNLTAGNNGGLFIAITLNEKEEPLLYTTVHTCGCYIAFIPTSFLPREMMPHKWDDKRQIVLGESLPGILDYKGAFHSSLKTMILFRDATHRIMDLWLEKTEKVFKRKNSVETKLIPMKKLEQLPLEKKGTTSFFEHDGPRKGYVKMSHKFWERLLMSWWAFDWRIGEDKMLGKDKSEGTRFYTSLKPWARDESDMRDFPAFLEYWGWGL